MEITIELPETLGQQLEPFQDRLPEVIERGLRELLARESAELERPLMLEHLVRLAKAHAYKQLAARQ